MRVHLVDGTVELFRCSHGAPLADRHIRGAQEGEAPDDLVAQVSRGRSA